MIRSLFLPRSALLAAALLAFVPLAAHAADEPAAAPATHEPAAAPATHEIEIPDGHFQHEGVFGTYDRAALQRGYQVYRQVCANCHSLKQLYYRNLQDIGLTENEVKALAMEAKVEDGPNDEGQMFERPGRPSDRLPVPFANDKAARAANGGALPPDLSLIAKAREGGSDYIHALLTGYADAPAGMTINEGLHYNTYFGGHQIAMPPPLTTDGVAVLSFADGTTPSVEEAAHDVATFLTWAAEPHMEERKRMGVQVMIFLAVFAGIMLAAKRRIWREAH